MAVYVKISDFAIKDSLLTGDPDKVITGAELDAEFNAIALSSSQNITAITNAQSAAEAAAVSAAADLVLTNADVVLTHADVVLTHADVALTAADVISATASASTATTQASNASTSASNAATSESNAAASESSAATSKTNAGTSETNAATSETNAKTSETNASASKVAAEAAAKSFAFKWTFSATTSMADPGSGVVRLNNTNPASVTAIAIDDNNSDAQDISVYVTSWDDSTNPNKGTVTLKQGASIAIYTVTGLTDNIGWTELSVTYITGSGLFSATEMYVGFVRAGDQGSSGIATDLLPGAATALQLLRVNTAGTAIEGYTFSANTQWTTITADPAPAVAGSSYLCNTSSAAFTVTLPAAPAANDLVRIADYAGTFATNNLTLGRNALNIMGLAEDMVISTNNVSITLTYVDATQGWRIV